MMLPLASQWRNAVALRIGYLLPTREQIMAGQPEATTLLALAERAENLGFDSIWAGDFLLARPRHEPLTLLAASPRACVAPSSAPPCCCRRCAIPS